MNSDLYFDGKQYISSSRAAKISGYVNDYIGQLCRDGKLDCRMVGRSWYVSFESLITHKNANGTASKNKTKKAIEIGPSKLSVEASQNMQSVVPFISEVNEVQSNQIPQTPVPSQVLVTVPVSEPPAPLLIREPSPPFVPQLSSLETVSYPRFESVVQESIVPSQQNSLDIDARVVPISFPKFTEPRPVVSPYGIGSQFGVVNTVSNRQRKLPQQKVAKFPKMFALSVSTTFAVIAFFFSLQMNPGAQLAYSNAFVSVKKNMSSVSLRSGHEANILSSASGAISQSAVFVYHTVNGMMFETRDKILVMAGLQDEKKIVAINRTEEDVRPADTGMVVVPIDENTNKDATVAKIKDAFSDEVSVSPATDNSSGVITPVFKKTKGNDYLYVLVPIKN